jgi:hypothetical protein
VVDLDIMNGARGEIVNMILDEELDLLQSSLVCLHKIPTVCLVKLLDGLEESVVPVESLIMRTRMQISIITYTGTVDVGTCGYLPTGINHSSVRVSRLSITGPDNNPHYYRYCTATQRSLLSRQALPYREALVSGHSTIRLLRDFGDDLFQKPLGMNLDNDSKTHSDVKHDGDLTH